MVPVTTRSFFGRRYRVERWSGGAVGTSDVRRIPLGDNTILTSAYDAGRTARGCHAVAALELAYMVGPTEQIVHPDEFGSLFHITNPLCGKLANTLICLSADFYDYEHADLATSVEIANEFLDRGIRGEKRLTPMQLQKLVYITHGWSLALLNRPLVTGEEVQAWDWGPVYPSLYDATKKYGPREVTELLRRNNWASAVHIRGDVVRAELDDEASNLIDAVYASYGDLEAFQLSALTHNDGTPWSEIYDPGVRGLTIPNQLIEAHFRDLAQAD